LSNNLSIWIKKIQNGFTVTKDVDEAIFCPNKVDVIKKVAELMDIEIGIEIKEKM
jgi:hypothetical protein